jgi:hypothetical protein
MQLSTNFCYQTAGHISCGGESLKVHPSMGKHNNNTQMDIWLPTQQIWKVVPRNQWKETTDVVMLFC